MILLKEICNNIGLIAGACSALITLTGFFGLISNKGKSIVSKLVKKSLDPIIDELKIVTKELNERKEEDKQLKKKIEANQNETKREINNIKEMFAEVTFTLNTDKESTLAALRHSITSIYQTYLPKKALPERVREDLMSLYNAYHNLGGNSYIHQIYEDMMEWSVE